MINALALTGPTASGKTTYSIELAKRIGAEIISCDSMQIYKGMDIGTAKATAEEQAAVRHHLIDIISPDEDYSTELYRKAAIDSARKITESGGLPLFVGGTGLYIDSLTRAPQTDVPESSREYRDSVLKEIKTEDDIHSLWLRLQSVDPESAEKIHENNIRRVIRALEIYDSTGKPKSYFDRISQSAEREISVKAITLDVHDRENLYRRINTRVDIMLRDGLVDEVKGLYERGLLKDGTTASQAIGYKEIIMYLRGKLTLAEASELIKLSSRRYAKRQLTWFRHNTDAVRIYLDSEDGKMRFPLRVMEEIHHTAEKYIKGF